MRNALRIMNGARQIFAKAAVGAGRGKESSSHETRAETCA